MTLRTVLQRVGIWVLISLLQSLIFAGLVYLLAFLVTFSVYSSYLLIPFQMATAYSSLAFLLEMWFSVFVDTGFFSLWGFLTKKKRTRRLVRGFTLGLLVASSPTIYYLSLLHVVGLSASVLIVSVFVDWFTSRVVQHTDSENLLQLNSFRQVYSSLGTASLRSYESLVCWVLLPLLLGSTVLSVDFSIAVDGPIYSWNYSSIVSLALVTSIIPAILYGLVRPFENPKGRDWILVVAISLSLLSFLSLSPTIVTLVLNLSIGRPLLILLSGVGVSSLVCYLLLMAFLTEVKKKPSDSKPILMKVAFWLVVVSSITALSFGLYYYSSDLHPLEWRPPYWYYFEITSILPPDVVWGFSRGVAFAVIGFLFPLYLSIGLLALCSDGKTTRTRAVAVVFGAFISFLIAIPDSAGVSNTLEVSIALVVPFFLPVIAVLRSKSKERCYVEVFALAVFACSITEVASALLGTPRAGLNPYLYAGRLALGGYSFLSILWIGPLIAVTVTAFVRLWSSRTITDNKAFDRILPWNALRSAHAWYLRASKRRRTLILLVILLSIVLVSVRPSIPSLYTVEDVTADVGSVTPSALSRTAGRIYVSTSYQTSVLYFQDGLRSYHYSSHYDIGSVLDTEARLNESDPWEGLSQFYFSTTEGLMAANVTHPWSDPAFVLNNTELENITFSDIELDSTATSLYAVSENSTLWVISVSDYSFMVVSLDDISSSAKINRIELRDKLLCLATTDGFCIYDTSSNQSYVPLEGPAIGKDINDIDTDGDRVYVATNEGLMIYGFSDEILVPERTINVPVLPSPVVTRIEYEHYLGGILIATHGGLCQYHLSSLSTEDYQETASVAASGLIDILSLQDDPNLRILILTGTGLYLFSINYGILRNPMWPVFQVIGDNAVSIAVAVVTSITTSASLWLLRGREKRTPKKKP